MTRILPMVWTAFGASLALAASDPRGWAFIAVMTGGAAIWMEVIR